MDKIACDKIEIPKSIKSSYIINVGLIVILAFSETVHVFKRKEEINNEHTHPKTYNEFLTLIPEETYTFSGSTVATTTSTSTSSTTSSSTSTSTTTPPQFESEND